MRKERYMDDTKLKKLGAELEKARTRQAEWTAKVRELERKYKEAENTCIHDMVHAAELTPEDLAVIIRKARAGVFDAHPAAPGGQNQNEEREESENE